VIVAVVACGAITIAVARPAAGERGAVCRALTRLAPSHRALVGSLRFGFYTDPRSPLPTRAHSFFEPGYPTKVLIWRDRRKPARRLELHGFDCETGKSLRFWYRDGDPFASLPASEEQLETTGDLTQVIPRGVRELHGYMLFGRAGKWRVNVWQRRRLLGKLVVQVGD
jgi:hypothetical protein